MKKILKILLILLVFVHIDVFAASFSVSVGNKKLNPGGRTTLKITGSDVTGRFNISLSKSSVASISDSSIWIENNSQQITISALNVGTTVVTVTPVKGTSDRNGNPVTLASKSITITVEKPREKSKDNNLKSLTVEGYTLSPEFNSDTLEYNVSVPENTKSIKINAQSKDGYASISGLGEKEVKPGINSFEVIVTPEVGENKIYKLIVNVIDENPVNIDINNKKYTLVKYDEVFTCPDYFDSIKIDIDEFNVPACINDKIKTTLVGIKDEEGKVLFASFKDDKYELVSLLKCNNLYILVNDIDKKLKYYKKDNIEINNKNVDVLKYKNNNNYIVYGKSLSDGKSNYYNYDKLNNTITVYDDELINDLSDNNKILYVVCFSLAAITLILFIIIIVISKKKNKKKKDK